MHKMLHQFEVSMKVDSPLLEGCSEILAFNSKFKKLKNMKKLIFKG
jgi:hypothetical protein